MSHRSLQFYFRGRIVEVQPGTIQTTVLQWLREQQRACGTKEGCNEGDCGACTVVVGALDADGQALTLRAVNACLQLLPALDGQALFTVEDLAPLGAPASALHPVQQALVDCHGSQCGFCTPGFVMSLWASYEQRDIAPDRATVEDVLSGNLCRCTGYRPIVDAAIAAYQVPRVTLERAPVLAALRALATSADLVVTDAAGHTWHSPRRLSAALDLLAAQPGIRIVAGLTDVGLWVTKQLRVLGDVLNLMQVAELRVLTRNDTHLEFGAAVPLETALGVLADEFPTWTELKRRFASLPIRNAGTLGGNVANGSPIGDSMPALIALGATVVLASASGARELPLEDFYLAYQKTALAAGELLRAVRVPRRRPTQQVVSYKLSKRFDQDISAVCSAVAFDLIEGRIVDPRIAHGGMAATPKRAPRAEAALAGQPLVQASFEAAALALTKDYTPLTDMRASAAYRATAAANLLRRAGLELCGEAPAASPFRLAQLAPI